MKNIQWHKMIPLEHLGLMLSDDIPIEKRKTLIDEQIELHEELVSILKHKRNKLQEEE